MTRAARLDQWGRLCSVSPARCRAQTPPLTPAHKGRGNVRGYRMHSPSRVPADRVARQIERPALPATWAPPAATVVARYRFGGLADIAQRSPGTGGSGARA